MCSTACRRASWSAGATRRRRRRRGRIRCSHRSGCRPRPRPRRTPAGRAGPGLRTDTPSGPDVLCASASITMSPLGASPSLFLKYASTASWLQPVAPSASHASKSPGMPTDVRHVVDPGATAEHLPPRHHHPAVAQAHARAARVGCVHPIRLRIELQWRTRDRHRRRGRWWPTRFDERNRAIRILGEPRRDDGPRRSPTHDNEIKRIRHASERTRGRETTSGRYNQCARRASLPPRTYQDSVASVVAAFLTASVTTHDAESKPRDCPAQRHHEAEQP